MSFHVKLYQISEEPDVVDKDLSDAKENDVSGVLFQDLEDVSTPWVELDKAASINPGSGKATFFTANYAYIPQMSRYYFVTGREIVDNDHYVLRMEVDPLMTFKTTLKATQFFVDRNENAGSWMIPDAAIPMSAEQTTTKTILNFSPFSPDHVPVNAPDDGYECRYLFLAAMGPIDTGVTIPYTAPDKDGSFHTSPAGACRVYALTRRDAKRLVEAVCSGGLDTWQSDNTNAVFSLKAYPFNLDADTSAQHAMLIGRVSTSSPTLIGNYVNKVIQTFASGGVLLPGMKDFRAASGDVKYQIHLPYLGFKELESAVVADRPYIKVEYKINVLTGIGICRIYQNKTGSAFIDAEITAVYEFVAGAEVPLSFSNAADIQRNQVSTVAGAALSILGAVATKNPALIGGAVAGAVGSIGNAMMTPVKTTMSGSMSGYAADLEDQSVYVLTTFRKSPVLDNDTQKTRWAHKYGKMYQQTTTLSSLTGKTVVSKFEMPIPAGCTMGEYDMIRRSLAEGVIL